MEQSATSNKALSAYGINNKTNRSTVLLNYLIIIFIIYISGSVLVSKHDRMLLAIAVLLSGYIFIKKKNKIDKELKRTIIFLFIITVVHAIEFSFFSLHTTTGTFVRFITPYFLVKITGKNFPRYYVSVMFVFAIISFIFYVPTILIPGFHNILMQIPPLIGTANIDEGNNIIIYAIESGTYNEIYRNAGLFWEPGAFACFLIIAILFNTTIERKLLNTTNIVFILAVITTISTAGYIALFLVICFFLMKGAEGSKQVFYILLLPLIVYLGVGFYSSMHFLHGKIENQIELAMSPYVEYGGRIGSGYNDLKDILKYPLFGKGRNVQTRFENYHPAYIKLFHRTNGTTDLAVKYGMLFWLFYFFNMFLSFKYMCLNYKLPKIWAVYMLIVILTIGFSQTIFQNTFFIALIYLHIPYKKDIVIYQNGK